MKQLFAILAILAYALISPLRVVAVDYNGDPNPGPDPANNIIFFDGPLPVECTSNSPSIAKKSTSLPSTATFEQKAAQTFIVGFDAGTPKSVIEGLFTKYKLGGLYLTGTTNAAAAGFDKAFYDKLSADAGVPIVASSDEEGVFTRYSYPKGSFPDAKTLSGKTDSVIESIVGKAAQAMASNGLTTDLAPVLDLVGVGNPNRNFSTNPATVTSKADAYAKGLQDSGIAPIFKHFPGFDASVAGQNTDTKKVTLATPLATLEAKNIAPYKALLSKYPDAGVMLGNMYANALDSSNPASISAKTVSYIRNTLKFQGLITTDDLAALTKYSGQNLPGIIASSLQSGVDMPLFQNQGSTQSSADASMQAILAKVKSDVPAKTIDAANTQVAAFKSGSSSTSGTPSTPTSGQCCPTSTVSKLSGNDNISKAFNYLIGRQISPIKAAGILGNFKAESGLDPTIQQDRSNDKLPKNGVGFGIAQWTFTVRQAPLVSLGAKKNPPVPPGDLALQLEYALIEMSPGGNRGSTLKAMDAAKNAYDAAIIFHDKFEGSADNPTQKARRGVFANEILALMGGAGNAASTSSNASSSCGSEAAGGNIVAGDIVKNALGLAWPTNVGHVGPESATPAYKAAWNGSSDMSDSGAFIGTVMVKSGVDKNYPHVSAIAQYNYVKAHPEKYRIITSAKSNSDLVPGDILVHPSHTMFYVGPQAGGFMTADASLHDHPPQLDTPAHLLSMLNNKETIVARVIK